MSRSGRSLWRDASTVVRCGPSREFVDPQDEALTGGALRRPSLFHSGSCSIHGQRRRRH